MTRQYFRILRSCYRQQRRDGYKTHQEALAWIAQWSQSDADLLAIIYADRA